jgi:ubiquinone/menaquinone biosynthesis C-methylase UbiE
MNGASRSHPVFAWGYAKLGPRMDRRGTAERRRELLSRASGTTVEVGAGTGLNLRYYPSAVSDLLAVEPDPHMFRRLVLALDGASVSAQLKRASAEALPVEDASVDTVVVSLTLCSVTDVGASLAEALRVLKSGGRLLFFEHVRSDDDERLARLQDRLERPWGWFGGGCHPNRDTLGAIRAAGFQVQDVERFDEPGAMLAKPHILGWALRP